jgi:hypothetical protein
VVSAHDTALDDADDYPASGNVYIYAFTGTDTNLKSYGYTDNVTFFPKSITN